MCLVADSWTWRKHTILSCVLQKSAKIQIIQLTNSPKQLAISKFEVWLRLLFHFSGFIPSHFSFPLDVIWCSTLFAIQHTFLNYKWICFPNWDRVSICGFRIFFLWLLFTLMFLSMIVGNFHYQNYVKTSPEL